MHILVDIEKWNKLTEEYNRLNLEVGMMRRVMGQFDARLQGMEANSVQLNPPPQQSEPKAPIIKPVDSPLDDVKGAGDIQIGYKHEMETPPATPSKDNVVKFPPKK